MFQQAATKLVPIIAVAAMVAIVSSQPVQADPIPIFNGDVSIMWNNDVDQDNIIGSFDINWLSHNLGTNAGGQYFIGTTTGNVFVPGWSGYPGTNFVVGSMFTNDWVGSPEIWALRVSNDRSTTNQVGVDLVGNTTYTLSVGIGKRLNDGNWNADDYLIELLADGQPLALTGSNVNPGLGEWDTAVFTFDSPLTVDPDQELAIRVSKLSGTGSMYFNNVTLSATLIPEPASLLLLGAGTVLILGRRRRMA